MTDLDRRLRDLKDHLDVPVATQLRAHVVDAIHAEPLTPRVRARRRVWVVVAAAVAGLGTAAAAPVVADWLGVGGVEVRRGPAPSEVRRVGGELDLGRAVTEADAERVVGHRLLRPAGLGEPDETWLDTAPAVPIATFLYRPDDTLPATPEAGVGALFSQVDASIAEELLSTKFADANTKITEVDLRSGRALWIEGSHYVALRDAAGNVIADRVRLAANVLLWEQAGMTLRLETALDRDRAVRIAETVR